ncbi:MAG TPA: J domain-containing protein [Burkholderiales bacterium]|nr:J domain-containing protein [Burkholderiales bacterium]
MSDYSRHYAVLRVTHDIDWMALRARYKRLIGKWHPDRFPADGSERELAEEHSKQITIAYQALERYYRDHGVLPPMERPQAAVDPAASVARDAAAATGTMADTPARGPARPVPGRRQRAFIVLCSIVMASFAAYHYSDEGARALFGTNADSASLDGRSEVPSRGDDTQQSGGITEGSTLGEVYAIQGIPTLTEGDIWHYGKSTIRFAQGKVVSWTQHPDNPLRIARDQPVELREGVFNVGSSKDEVRLIQGTPVSETETVWDYGTSRVYFEHNRVVRWEASPLQPLHVPR